MKREIARALIEIGAVGFKPSNPLIFKSGLVSPVYIDNRIFPFFPDKWGVVIEGMRSLIKEKSIDFDVVAGVEAAGIPHSAALGFLLKKPSVFVRKQVKDHGTKKMVEGGDVKGKKVLLIEDLVTTGSSSLAGVESLRDSGAIVNDCMVIISYGFREAEEAFLKSKTNLQTLTSFDVVLDEALKMDKFSKKDKVIIEDWFSEP